MNPHTMRGRTGQVVGQGSHGEIKANKGDIVIFPSDLVHYVKPNPRKEDRISISMNLQLC